jgi:hypothetical protein
LNNFLFERRFLPRPLPIADRALFAGPPMRYALYRPTPIFLPMRKALSNMTSWTEIGRFLGDILRQMLLRFQPDALELRTEAYVDFLIYRSPCLNGLQPSGEVRYHFVLSDLVDSQPKSLISRNAGFSRFSPPIKMGLDWPGPYF